LVVIDTPANAMRAGDAGAWREQLAALDEQWIRPLLGAVRMKQIDALALVACNSENLLETDLSRQDLWRFWRHRRPLGTYADDS
jgi:hypothetical protein